MDLMTTKVKTQHTLCFVSLIAYLGCLIEIYWLISKYLFIKNDPKIRGKFSFWQFVFDPISSPSNTYEPKPNLNLDKICEKKTNVFFPFQEHVLCGVPKKNVFGGNDKICHVLLKDFKLHIQIQTKVQSQSQVFFKFLWRI